MNIPYGLQGLMQLSQPTPPRRGRGRPRGRRRTRQTSSDESDGDFTGYASVANADSSRHISLRSRSSHSLTYTEASSGSDTETPRDQVRGDGPPIKSVLCRAPGEVDGHPQFLVKWNDRAFIHSTLIGEPELRRGVKSGRALSDFMSRLQSAEALSDLGHGFVEPAGSRECVEHFFVDRVMAHRSIADDARIPSALLGPDVYVPSLPLDSVVENEQLMKWANPMYQGECGEEPELFAGQYGVLTIVGGQKQAVEGEKQTEEIEGGREKIEYLLKWKGLGASEATWELPEKLNGVDGEIFAAANMDELSSLVDVYWGKKKEVPMRPLQVPEPEMMRDYVFGRGVRMTEEQLELVGKLFDNMKRGVSCVVLGSGRMLAVCGFLELMRHVYGVSKPALVVADDAAITLWAEAIKLSTSLQWIDYIGTPADRLVTKNNELSSNDKYDVVLSNADVISQELRFLAWKDWSVVIMDLVHGTLPDLDVLRESFTIVLSNEKVLDYEIIAPSFEPLKYQEEFVFVRNNFHEVVAYWLRSIIKSRGIRHTTLKNAESLAGQLILSLAHPFASPELKAFVIKEKKIASDIPEEVELTPAQERMIFSEYSTRLQKLKELVNPDLTSVVVASTLALLRMIYEFLKSVLPCGILDTPVKEEKLAEQFTKGVILITRECYSPRLFATAIDQVIFYDTVPSHKKDTDLLQVLRTNSPGLSVKRLILTRSLEADLYYKTITDEHFNFKCFKNREAEGILRIAYLSSQPDRPIPAADRADFLYPEDLDELYQRLGCSAKDTQADDFWNMASAVKIARQAKDPWMGQMGVVLAGEVSRLHFRNWADVGAKIEMPEDETKAHGRGTLLAIFSQIGPESLPFYNLANAAAWFEFNTDRFTNEFDSPGYWQRLAATDPIASNPVLRFGKTELSVLIRSQADGFLRQMEICMIITAFLEIRDETYFPPRFLCRSDVSFSDPVVLRKFLSLFLQYGDAWIQYKTTEEFATMDENVIRGYFPQIYSAVCQDVLSFVTHGLASDPPSLDKYASLKEIIMVLEQGPFLPVWKERELNVILKTLFDFAVPFAEDGQYDWCEFHALTQMTTKSTTLIATLTSFLLENIPSGHQFVIPATIMATGATSLPVSEGFLEERIVMSMKQRLSTLTYVRQMQRNLPKEFRTQDKIPTNWDISCDQALVQGICQFGFSKMQGLALVDITKYSSYPHDAVMTTNLSDFKEFFANESDIVQRLNWVIISNCPVKRKIVFWANPVRHFSFFTSTPLEQHAPVLTGALVPTGEPVKQKRKRRTKQEMLEAKRQEELARQMAEMNGSPIPKRKRGRPSKAETAAKEMLARAMAEASQAQEPIRKEERPKPEPVKKPPPKEDQKAKPKKPNPMDVHISFYVEDMPKKIVFID